MKARERILKKTAYKKTDINPNGVKIMKTCLEYMGLNIQKCLTSRNISADLKGPKEKYKQQVPAISKDFFLIPESPGKKIINFVFVSKCFISFLERSQAQNKQLVYGKYLGYSEMY